MTTRNTTAMGLAEFEHLLDVYGADRTRWPIASRASAAACLAANDAARKLHAETAALDAVLLRSDEPDKMDVGALVERIVAATRITPRLAASTLEPERVAPVPGEGASLATSRTFVSKEWMRGMALLAASLVIGIFVGQSQLGARAVPALEDLTGFSASRSTDRLAMLDLHIEAVDED